MAVQKRNTTSLRKRISREEIGVVPTLVRDAQVTTLINLAARLTHKAARLRLGSIGAWPGQIPILLWLLQEDGVIQRDLVDWVGMEQSSVAEHLKRMEREGLVIRRRSNDDRRMFRIYLTPKARELSTEVLDELEGGARLFTRGVSKANLKVFEDVLRHVIQNILVFVAAYEARQEGSSRRD